MDLIRAAIAIHYLINGVNQIVIEWSTELGGL